jgi:hypothetical protein
MKMTVTDFQIRDSGERQEFETGAKRDTQDGKPRYGLVPVEPLLRLAMHYTKGADKYDDNNWKKGIPMSRSWESLERHVQAFKAGDKVEDHLAAIAWNAFALMWYEEKMPEMDDLAEYLGWPVEEVEDFFHE